MKGMQYEKKKRKSQASRNPQSHQLALAILMTHRTTTIHPRLDHRFTLKAESANTSFRLSQKKKKLTKRSSHSTLSPHHHSNPEKSTKMASRAAAALPHSHTKHVPHADIGRASSALDGYAYLAITERRNYTSSSPLNTKKQKKKNIRMSKEKKKIKRYEQDKKNPLD